jgi:hypothetical protein
MGTMKNNKQIQYLMELFSTEIMILLLGNIAVMPATEAKQGTWCNQAAMFSTRQKSSSAAPQQQII